VGLAIRHVASFNFKGLALGRPSSKIPLVFHISHAIFAGSCQTEQIRERREREGEGETGRVRNPGSRPGGEDAEATAGLGVGRCQKTRPVPQNISGRDRRLEAHRRALGAGGRS
jgi:hypothetical protein